MAAAASMYSLHEDASHEGGAMTLFERLCITDENDIELRPGKCSFWIGGGDNHVTRRVPLSQIVRVRVEREFDVPGSVRGLVTIVCCAAITVGGGFLSRFLSDLACTRLALGCDERADPFVHFFPFSAVSFFFLISNLRSVGSLCVYMYNLVAPAVTSVFTINIDFAGAATRSLVLRATEACCSSGDDKMSRVCDLIARRRTTDRGQHAVVNFDERSKNLKQSNKNQRKSTKIKFIEKKWSR